MATNSSLTPVLLSPYESAAYTYDDLGRLVTSNQASNSASTQRRFAYDRWGNRTGAWDATTGGTQIQNIALQQTGGAPTNQIASVTAGGVTKNYLYDPAGNLINDGVHTYQYDAENRLKSVDNGATAAYDYDNQNRRIKKIVGGTSTHYVWEGSQVISDHDGTTGAVIYNYVYSGSTLLARMGSGIINWYLSDQLSTRLVLDNSGNVIGRQSHLPFGEDFGESGTQEKHHFTGYERDTESGSDYAVNRQYSQSVGRFNRPDPYSRSYNPGDPQSLNRYAYVRNDPVNKLDPLGLLTLCACSPNEVGPPTCECRDIDDPETGDGSDPTGNEGRKRTAGDCRKHLRQLQKKAAEAFVIGVTNSQQIAGNAGQSYLGYLNDGISYFQDPARFPFTGTNEVNAVRAFLYFSRLGARTGEHFETAGGRRLARQLASRGRNALDGLFEASQYLLDTCKDVGGLSAGELQAIRDLRDASQFASVTYLQFFIGVLSGLTGTET